MIATFMCRDTRALFEGSRIARFVNIEIVAIRKLVMLNRSATLEDLRIPPSNRLKPLAGNKAGYWSIRINDQWRIVFKFADGQAFEVEIVDYH